MDLNCENPNSTIRVKAKACVIVEFDPTISSDATVACSCGVKRLIVEETILRKIYELLPLNFSYRLKIKQVTSS